jgi:hypothetical protein
MKLSSILAEIFMLLSFILSLKGYCTLQDHGGSYDDDLLGSENCNHSVKPFLVFSYLIANVGFASFIHSRIQIAQNNDDPKKEDILTLSFVIFDILYIVFVNLPFQTCEQPDTTVFVRELVQTLISYILNVIVVSTAHFCIWRRFIYFPWCCFVNFVKFNVKEMDTITILQLLFTST